jgi:hypothetical protein
MVMNERGCSSQEQPLCHLSHSLFLFSHCDRVFENLQTFIDFLFRDAKRGSEADRGFATAEQ